MLSNEPVERQDLDENTLIDIDQQGNVCSIVLEDASERIGTINVHYEHIISPTLAMY